MRRLRAARDDDRGAVLPMVAILLVVLLMASAFAVDLGMQRVVARDVQGTADAVALDMARLLDGQSRPADLDTTAAWQDELDASLARNDARLGDLEDVDAVAGQLSDAGAFTRDPDAPADAVQVTVAGSVAFGFAPAAGGPDRGGATRAATAVSTRAACFALGSWAARLDADGSALLGPLLGAVGVDALDAGAVGYTGLVNLDTTVPLLDLAAELDAGTVDELLDTDVTLDELRVAMIDVLQTQGGADALAAAQVLQLLTLAVAPVELAIADLIALGPGADAALTTEVNVLDLLSAAALAVDGEHFLAVQDLGIDLSSLGLGTVANSSLHLIQRPQIGCGTVDGATAATSQLGLSLGGTLVGIDTASLLPLLGGLANVSVTAGMQLDVAGATGTGVLRDIRCDSGTAAAGIDVDVTSSLAEVDLTVPIRITGDVLGLLGIRVARVTVELTARVVNPGSSDVRTAVLDFPPTAYGEAVPAGASGLSLSGLTVTTSTPTTDVEVLGLNVGGLVQPLLNAIVGNVGAIANGIVVPLVGTLDAQLLTPLSDLAGLSVAGVDVIGLEAPSCRHPALVG